MSQNEKNECDGIISSSKTIILFSYLKTQSIPIEKIFLTPTFFSKKFFFEIFKFVKLINFLTFLTKIVSFLLFFGQSHII